MKALAAVAAALMLVAAGCGGTSSSPEPKQSALTDLQSVDQLRTLFDAHAPEPRLILLISPT